METLDSPIQANRFYRHSWRLTSIGEVGGRPLLFPSGILSDLGEP